MVRRVAIAVCLLILESQSRGDASVPGDGSSAGCPAEAQLIALDAGSATYPDPTLCARLAADLSAIRRREPQLSRIRYWAMDDGRELLLMVEKRTFSQMQRGSYKTWSRIWRRWGEPTITFQPGLQTWNVSLRMPRIMRLDEVAKAYAQLPGVLAVEPHSMGGDGPNIVVRVRGNAIHYVFDDAGGDCPSGCTTHHQYYFVTDGSGGISRVAEWSNSAPPPVVPNWLIDSHATH
jgi:hypothetical protein